MTRYEPELTDYLMSKFSSSTVFIDVGANMGRYTFMAAPLVQEVVAFEPLPRFSRTIRDRAFKEGWVNVFISELALFSMDKEWGRVDSRGVFHRGDGGVRTARLDSLYLAPTLMKIDVEGAEMDVLLGARETLLEHHPDLAIEVHHRRIEKCFGFKAAQVSKFLEDLGYTVSLLKPDGGHICAEWAERWTPGIMDKLEKLSEDEEGGNAGNALS